MDIFRKLLKNNNEIKITMTSSFNYDIKEEIESLIESDGLSEKTFEGFKDWFNETYENGEVNIFDYMERQIRLELPEILDDVFNRYRRNRLKDGLTEVKTINLGEWLKGVN